MKKLVSFLIALTVLVGIGIATYFMISQSKNNETYSISVSTTSGGSVNVKLDNNTYTIVFIYHCSNTHQFILFSFNNLIFLNH